MLCEEKAKSNEREKKASVQNKMRSEMDGARERQRKRGKKKTKPNV